MTPLYSVGTWDANAQAYTPQEGLSVPSVNVPLHGLRAALKALRREFGYAAWRMRYADNAPGDWDTHDSDTEVLVERTDGESEAEVLERWKR